MLFASDADPFAQPHRRLPPVFRGAKDVLPDLSGACAEQQQHGGAPVFKEALSSPRRTAPGPGS